MKTAQEAMDWIQSLLTFGIKPGLERMQWLLASLNHPERRLKVIHVAGTNGKGSTSEYLTQMLMRAEQEVGTFTSPHFTHMKDRIAVDGLPIPDDDFLEVANEVRRHVEKLPKTYGEATEFEVMTVLALQYFATVAYPDIVIVETGLGGRLDSTNVIHPMLSIITNVSFDHTDILGSSIEEIAREKAGIIKSGVPVVTGAQGEALRIIEEVAQEKNAKCYRYGYEFTTENEQAQDFGEQFDYVSPFYRKEALCIYMQGKQQIENAALALMALDYLYFYMGLIVDEEDVYAGLKAAQLKGRFEQISAEPIMILDGAHNEEAMIRLTETIKERFPNQRIQIIFAALKTKDVKQMIAHLEKVADNITLTTFSHANAMSISELRPLVNDEAIRKDEQWEALLRKILQKKTKDVITVITGSLYFVAEVRTALQTLIS